MTRTAMLDTAEDMKWLRDVHLPKLPAKYKSAIVYGNDDWPDRIEVYARRAPLVTDKPVVFEPDTEGVFHQTAKRHHATMKTGKTGKKSPAQLSREIATALARKKPKGFSPGDPNNDNFLRHLDDFNDPPRTALHRAAKADRSHSTVKAKRVPKTRVIFVVQGNYGYGGGWEDLTAEGSRKEALQRLREYRENESGPHRLIRRRERIVP